LELLETVPVYKLPTFTREEIQKMRFGGIDAYTVGGEVL